MVYEVCTELVPFPRCIAQRAPGTTSDDGFTSEDGNAHRTHTSQHMRLTHDRYTYTRYSYHSIYASAAGTYSICIGGGACGCGSAPPPPPAAPILLAMHAHLQCMHICNACICNYASSACLHMLMRSTRVMSAAAVAMGRGGGDTAAILSAVLLLLLLVAAVLLLLCYTMLAAAVCC